MKRRAKKRGKGVSPLIATILLVGFTVSIVALTILWSRGYIEERAEKEEKLSSTKLACEQLKFTVTDDTYSRFHPAIYEGFTSTMKELEGYSVDRVMVYDGAFGGIFSKGDEVELCGIIQHVIPKDSRDLFYQVMIGTKLGAGQEYIRFS
mgnify:CR=1 FL=1